MILGKRVFPLLDFTRNHGAFKIFFFCFPAARDFALLLIFQTEKFHGNGMTPQKRIPQISAFPA